MGHKWEIKVPAPVSPKSGETRTGHPGIKSAPKGWASLPPDFNPEYCHRDR
jgi:hypothetical protein